MSDVTILRADRWLDIEAGEVRSPAVIVIDGNQIVGVNPHRSSRAPPTKSTSVTSRSCRALWTWSSTCSSADRAARTGCPTRCTG